MKGMMQPSNSAIGLARRELTMHRDRADDRVKHHAAERGDAERDARRCGADRWYAMLVCQGVGCAGRCDPKSDPGCGQARVFMAE